jgi:hypothetical protein
MAGGVAFSSQAIEKEWLSIFANTIYDPSSERPGPGGGPVRDPFQNNIIPPIMISPVAQKIQSLFPNPINANYVNNAVGTNVSRRTTVIPSLKIDQVVGSKGRLSFYWSQTQTDSQYSSPNGNADGLPDEISRARGTFFHYWVARVNYDHTLSPTLLLHVGAGYNQIFAPDTAPYTSFNAQQQIGVAGFQSNRNFPYISGMCVAPPPGAVGCDARSLGGMQPIGTSNGIQTRPYSQSRRRMPALPGSTEITRIRPRGKSTSKGPSPLIFRPFCWRPLARSAKELPVCLSRLCSVWAVITLASAMPTSFWAIL